MGKPEKKASEDAAATAAAPGAAAAQTVDVKQALTEALPPISALLASEIWARDGGVRFNTWEAVPREGTPLENALRPEFWAHVARRLKPGSTILVYPADGAWYAELIVWDAGQNWARVSHKIQPLQRPAFMPAPGVSDDFEVRYHPSKAWQVVRRATNQVLKENFPNAADARNWIVDHQKALRT
jgi:hypothetical protein